ncbi:MAG: cysteine desulfurase family protein [bacterium]|nr:cysteine desulfurase family protein [bacterium]MDY4099359.1 cysteine desulfurase family protein [Lachnospiraceae bacterium]
MEAYFDNSATTRCSDSVVALMQRVLLADYGNPSSLHMKGVVAEKYMKTATEQIARTLKVEGKEIIFTSGGTESNNLALIGVALANQRAGKHIITTSIEHASVYNPLIFLEEQGFEVTYLPVDEKGVISLEALKEAVREDTILVSLMHVNNEIGTIEPVEEAAKLIREKNPRTLIHVDAIQSFGKLRIYPKRMGIDLLSVSGHKIHGPKGVGFLYVKDKTKIKPIIHGGGQQKNMRSGTENVAGIAGLGEAVEELYRDFDEKIDRLYELREYLVAGMKQLEGTTINGAEGRDAAPHIVSVSFSGIRAEVLLHALEERGIYVSTGSACSSNHPAISGTLKAIGVKPELLDSTVRFSLSVESTREEADYVLEQLAELLPMLRRFRRH